MTFNTGDRITIGPQSIFKTAEVSLDGRVRANDIIQKPCSIYSVGDRVTFDPIGIRKSNCGFTIYRGFGGNADYVYTVWESNDGKYLQIEKRDYSTLEIIESNIIRSPGTWEYISGTENNFYLSCETNISIGNNKIVVYKYTDYELTSTDSYMPDTPPDPILCYGMGGNHLVIQGNYTGVDRGIRWYDMDTGTGQNIGQPGTTTLYSRASIGEMTAYGTSYIYDHGPWTGSQYQWFNRHTVNNFTDGFWWYWNVISTSSFDMSGIPFKTDIIPYFCMDSGGYAWLIPLYSGSNICTGYVINTDDLIFEEI